MLTIKKIGILILLLFSFFYISKINEVMIYQNNLLKEIDVRSNSYNKNYVDAIIYGDYIVPGIKGLEVNLLESYYNMKSINTFGEVYLKYDEVTPSISIVNNKNKLIEKGNPSNRSISIIIDDNEYIQKYMEINNIKGNILVTYETYLDNTIFEQINNDITNFNRLNNLIDNKICIINNNNKDICMKHSYYLVEVKELITNENYIDVKNNLYSGQILYISNLLSLENFETIYREILFKDYELVFLSKLISE